MTAGAAAEGVTITENIDETESAANGLGLGLNRLGGNDRARQTINLTMTRRLSEKP